MSWLFSRALVEEYSAASCLAGEPFVQSNGNRIPRAYCAPDKMTGFSRLSRFGMTYGHLTEIRGEELLTLYREDFLARTSVLPDTVQAFPAVDQDSGLKWQGLLGKYDHDTRSWKTAQCSLLEDLEQCLEIWPRWGLMRDGVSYQQQTLVRHTLERESGLWATPTTMDKLPPKSEAALHREATIARLGRSKPANLRDQVSNMKRWPTVTATANQLAPSMQSRYANPIFPTPTTGGGGGERSAKRAGTGNLDFMARTNKWPTPTASDYTGAGHSAQGGKNLRTMVAENKWPTPRVCDYKGGGQQMIRKDGKSRMDQLCFNVEYQETGRLNPTWVEWLMGWPLEWTDLKPLETDKFQEWQQQHSDF
jgi:hypothetical protein